MNNTVKTALTCAVLTGFCGAAQAEIQVDWYRTAAPNVFGAASYAGFWANAQESIINQGGSNWGTGKSAFTNSMSVTGLQSYVTSFESLNGVYEAGEHGTRPSWVYYISNDDGSTMTYNDTFAGATKNYGDTWGGVSETFWGDIPFGSMAAAGRIGVRADGSTGIDPNEAYVGFLAISGIAWTPWNWTGTLGVDHAWTTEIDNSDPDRFAKLQQLGAWLGTAQDSWDFSINIQGIDYVAPSINVVPVPTAALAGMAMLGGIAGVRTIRRRK